MRTGEYAQVCTALQINKAIPLLLDMRNDLKEIKADQKEMKADQKEMMADQKAVKGNTDTIPQILEEIKGLKEDIQPGYAIQFKQVQTDVTAIKERLGML
jgi:predicted nuclease with TOPRIM domain